MRIAKQDGQEVCTYCGSNWKSSTNYPMLCDNCFCPQNYCTLVDDVAWHQSGMLKNLIGDPISQGAISDLKDSIEDQLKTAVPPMTWQELCRNQPMAKRLFEEDRQNEIQTISRK